MSVSTQPLEDETDSRSKVPIWLPVSAFIGTSVAIAIPLLMVRKQRRTTLPRLSLQKSSTTTPPPRRRQPPASAASTTEARARLVARASTPSSATFKSESTSADETTPGLGSLMSAMSQLNRSNAVFAGKAFVIATTLVTVGGGLFAWGVKTALGVNEVHEFGTKMRSFLWSTWPSLASRIHRSPETDEERQESLRLAPFGVQEEWNTDASEERLRKAYDQGGVGVWAQVALRELEAEARVERAKREKEVLEDKAKVNATQGS